MAKSLRVATDVGGTFTDLVAFEVDNQGSVKVLTAKTPTTSPNFDIGVLDAIDKSGVAIGDVRFFAHGTTVVINALTERRGVKVGLITTDGFRDGLEIARGNRPDFFNLHYRKPPPFVPRYLRRELRGRMNYRGEELTPIDLQPLGAIIEDFRAEGVEAIAVAFLHSYANPSHELAALAELRQLWPEVFSVASHQVTREWREYERTSTAVLSAYVQPIAEQYLKRLHSALRSKGFEGTPYVMQSNGGVDSLAAVAATPITMVESGPASGFWGAAELGRLIGETNLLALDIGGTTAKCTLIKDGRVRIMTDYWIEKDRVSAGYPIMVPVVDLVEIGSGGGSIASVDEYGKLHVGPHSVGAQPGPAAFGRGGVEATTTDANLWLNRINHSYFAGGEVEADMGAVEMALGSVATKLGISLDDTARGIVRIANNDMVNALKLVSVNRGFDPRDFTLVAFGGGGPMHAVALATELGIKKIVIPANASIFSAWGMLMSDIRRDYFMTRLADLTPENVVATEAAFAETEAAALRQFASEGVAPEKVRFERFGKFRYRNQEHTTEVLISGSIGANSYSSIDEDFRRAYESEYTYRLDAAVEIVAIHVVAYAAIEKLAISARPLADVSSGVAMKGEREVDFAPDGIHRAAIYDGAKLVPGMKLSGPAVIEERGTTVVIHPHSRAEIDGYGNVVILIESSR